MITEHTALSEQQREAVLALAERVAAADRVSPLNEAAQLALADQGSGDVIHWLVEADDALIGYAQLDRRDGSIQLFITPKRRRKGFGQQLAQQVMKSGLARTWWAFGDRPPARAFANSLGLEVVRGLLVMTLDPTDRDEDEPAEPPPGVSIDHFRDADLERLVEVNAAAFANHPEQGALTVDDFRARMASDWFRPDDLLVARDVTGELVGYHWTKLTTVDGKTRGEVYVLGVDPSQARRGTGRALLDAGIIHMRSRGASLIDLYVEASSERVVAMYRTAGFEVTNIDVAYGPVEEL